MRTSKPIILFVPDSFITELDDYLHENPPGFSFNRVNFYYVAHHLIKLQIQFKKEEYHYLNLECLKKVTCSKIGRYIKLLRDGKFVLGKEFYVNGFKAYRYKLNETHIECVSRIELTRKSKLTKKIMKLQKNTKANYNRQEPHVKVLREEFMKMELEYDSAYEWANKSSDPLKKLSYLTSLYHLENKSFRYCGRNKTNCRLDTNLTCLKSDFRKFINGDYVSIDVKNSQPFLLSVLIDAIIHDRGTLCGHLGKEYLAGTFGVKGIQRCSFVHQNQEKAFLMNVRNYAEAVIEGVLYDDFVRSYPGEIKRDKAKDITFMVLFSQNECYTRLGKMIPYEEEKKVFATVYPFIYRIVKTLKLKDYKALPIYLQKLESYLFIDCIAKRLIEAGIVPLTIHDSVIVKSEDQAKTLAIMKEVFIEQIGVTPSFKVERLKGDSDG